MHNVRDDQGKVVSPVYAPKSDKYLYLNKLFNNSFPGGVVVVERRSSIWLGIPGVRKSRNGVIRE